jgi:hypothetical protein
LSHRLGMYNIYNPTWEGGGVKISLKIS